MVNVYLMVNMRAVTWIQYGIYMIAGKQDSEVQKSHVSNCDLWFYAPGLLVYTIYGWRNSKEEERLQGKYNLLNEAE